MSLAERVVSTAASVIFASFVACGPARAAEPGAFDHAGLARQALEKHIQPGYAALVSAAATLTKSLDDFCARRTAEQHPIVHGAAIDEPDFDLALDGAQAQTRRDEATPFDPTARRTHLPAAHQLRFDVRAGAARQRDIEGDPAILPSGHVLDVQSARERPRVELGGDRIDAPIGKVMPAFETMSNLSAWLKAIELAQHRRTRVAPSMTQTVRERQLSPFADALRTSGVARRRHDGRELCCR